MGGGNLQALLSTHRGDRLDFKPAQDARQLVGRGIGGPLDPHVLQQEERKRERQTEREREVLSQRAAAFLSDHKGGRLWFSKDALRLPCMMIKNDYNDEDEGECDHRQESMFIEARQSC